MSSLKNPRLQSGSINGTDASIDTMQSVLNIIGQDVPIRRQRRRTNSMRSLRIPEFYSGSIKGERDDA